MTNKHYGAIVLLALAVLFAAWDGGHGTGKAFVAFVLFIVGFVNLDVLKDEPNE